MSSTRPKSSASSSTEPPTRSSSTIDKALAGDTPVVWLTDVKGRRIGIPASRIAYIEVDEDGANKRVGFGR